MKNINTTYKGVLGLAFGMILAPSIMAAEINQGLVAFLPCNDNANDASGNGHHGMVRSATLAADRFNVPNAAYQFNGNGYIEIPAHPQMDNTNFTIMAWMKSMNGTGTVVDRLWEGTNAASILDVFSMVVYPTETMIVFNGDRDSEGLCGREDLRDPFQFTPGQWCLWCVTKEGPTIKSYINGVLRQTYTYGCDMDPYGSPANWLIGAQMDYGSIWDGFIGSIDEVRFYNRALSATEVRGIQDADLDYGLVAHYAMDGNPQDSSPYRNHGVQVGSVTYPDNVPLGKAGQFMPAGAGHIEVPHAPQLVLENAFTIQFWYNSQHDAPNGLSSGRILQKHYPAWHAFGNTWDVVHDSGNVVKFYHCWPGGANNFSAVCPVPVTNGVWQQITYTYSVADNTIRAFLNGDLVTETVATHSVLPFDTTLPLLIMRDRANFRDAAGSLDEVRIYNRALSGREIRDLHNLEKPALLNLAKAVRLDGFNLRTGVSYQLQSSTDLANWTNVGAPFTATGASSSQFLDIGNWSMFWRFQVVGSP